MVTVAFNHVGIPENTIVEPWSYYSVPSLAITAKGIGVRLTELELRLCRNIRQPTVIADPGLAADARLWTDGADVYASKGSNLWRVRTG